MTIKRVSPADAQALLDEQGYVYLDVRSVPEFEAGHPAGAYNIPIAHMGAGGMRPNANFLSEVAAAFPTDTKLVIGCKSGGRSLRAAQALAQAGYTELVDQRAGFGGARNAFGQLEEPGWQTAGLSVATEADAGRSYADLSSNRED
ncbi:MAG: rhodanese-like domain-containing protein [Myxococcota bacterium]